MCTTSSCRFLHQGRIAQSLPPPPTHPPSPFPSCDLSPVRSFYALPSSILGHPEHTELNAAYQVGACYRGLSACSDGLSRLGGPDGI